MGYKMCLSSVGLPLAYNRCVACAVTQTCQMRSPQPFLAAVILLFCICRRPLSPTHLTGHLLQLLKVAQWNSVQQPTHPNRLKFYPFCLIPRLTPSVLSELPSEGTASLPQMQWGSSSPVPWVFQGPRSWVWRSLSSVEAFTTYGPLL